METVAQVSTGVFTLQLKQDELVEEEGEEEEEAGGEEVGSYSSRSRVSVVTYIHMQVPLQTT